MQAFNLGTWKISGGSFNPVHKPESTWTLSETLKEKQTKTTPYTQVPKLDVLILNEHSGRATFAKGHTSVYPIFWRFKNLISFSCNTHALGEVIQ